MNSDSDEEPSPEALARYLAMRRHTVGVGDTRHEVSKKLHYWIKELSNLKLRVI